MTDEVKFTDEQWDKVAEAAETFADALEDEHGLLTHVLAKNWAGDCTEGVGIIDNLKDSLRGPDASFSAAIRDEASYLRSLAAQCVRSKGELNVSDTESSVKFKG